MTGVPVAAMATVWRAAQVLSKRLLCWAICCANRLYEIWPLTLQSSALNSSSGIISEYGFGSWSWHFLYLSKTLSHNWYVLQIGRKSRIDSVCRVLHVKKEVFLISVKRTFPFWLLVTANPFRAQFHRTARLKNLLSMKFLPWKKQDYQQIFHFLHIAFNWFLTAELLFAYPENPWKFGK